MQKKRMTVFQGEIKGEMQVDWQVLGEITFLFERLSHLYIYFSCILSMGQLLGRGRKRRDARSVGSREIEGRNKSGFLWLGTGS